jgi:hypothetical protein
MHRHVTVVLLAGVWGAARTHTRELATRETCRAAGQSGNVLTGGWARQASEGLIVPLKPANTGGGKEPWFGVRLNEPR